MAEAFIGTGKQRHAAFTPVGAEDILDYPLSNEDRLDSHYFVPWERRRWLNSDMRLRGTAECRAIYLDLIFISYDQSPVGTLPVDTDILARLAMVDPVHMRALCNLPFGPLHRWERCRCEGGEIRLMHPMVLRTLTEAIARKEDNRAKNDAANAAKRRQRLRITVSGYSADLARNDAALLFMDEWLMSQGCEYRSSSWIERAVSAWSDHMLALTMRARSDRS